MGSSVKSRCVLVSTATISYQLSDPGGTGTAGTGFYLFIYLFKGSQGRGEMNGREGF